MCHTYCSHAPSSTVGVGEICSIVRTALDVLANRALARMRCSGIVGTIVRPFAGGFLVQEQALTPVILGATHVYVMHVDGR